MSTDHLHKRVEQLESKVEALESLFTPRVLNKEQAHTQAKGQDARDKLQVGDVHRIFIRDIETGNGRQPKQGIGQIEGIVTFVEPGEVNFEQGDAVEAKITDVKQNAAEAYAIENIG